jgi:hypothetical protein
MEFAMDFFAMDFSIPARLTTLSEHKQIGVLKNEKLFFAISY